MGNQREFVLFNRRIFQLAILLSFVQLLGAEVEQVFIPQDPPPRPKAVEYELLPAADESIRAIEGNRIEWIRRLPRRSLIGRVALQLRKEVPIPADSVQALIRVVDVSGDTLEVFAGRFNRDGRLEAAFDGVYASAVSVSLIGANDTMPADLQISGIVLGAATRIMLIGDSITAGKFADDMIGFRKVLHDKLRADGIQFELVGGYGDPPYEGHFQGSMKINDYYPANMTPGARGRMDVTSAMNNFRPNIAVLHVGTNDLATEPETPVAPYGNGSGFAATQTGELGTLVRYLLRWNDGTAGKDLTAVVVCLIIPIKYEDSLCVAFNLETARLVNDFRNGRITGKPEPVYLCDVFSRFREWPNLIENGYKALMYDKLHPNTAGHNLMGEALFETLAPLLGAPKKWFADVTAYAGLLGADHLFEHQGVAVADVDNDGREEVHLTRTNAAASDRFALLFGNSNVFPLSEKTSAWGIDGKSMGRGAVFFDMDNDGDLDLFLGVSGGRNRLYENLNGSFRDITTAGGIADLPRVTTGVAAFDADNDGDLDLYAVNSREKNEFYLNQNGRFALQNRGTEDAVEPNIPSLSLAAADVDADDDVDLYIVKRGAANKLFLNDGSGWFQEAAAPAGIDWTASSNSAAFADLDNDGDLDLLIGVTASSTDPAPNSAVFENRGGTFNRRNLNLPMDGYSILAEDFDNDGDLDLLLTQEENRAALYRNDGNWRFTLLTGTGAEIHAGDVRGAAAFDLESDGDLDILAARADMFNVLLRNQLRNGNHFLRVLARGPNNSAVGYGTKIWLFEPGRLGDRNALIGFQEVQSSGGHISQPSAIRHFGLKDKTACDLLARFNNGSYIALKRAAADQTLVIAPPEPSANPEPAQLTLIGGDNQRGTVGERLSLPLAVKVTDRSGRPVRGSAVMFRVNEGDAELFTPSTPAGRIALPPETGQLTQNAVRAAGTDCADGSFVLIPPHRRGPASVLLEKAVPSNEYTLWLRLRNPGPEQSIRILIDAGTPYTVGCPNLLEWSWIALPNRLRMTSGLHAFAVEFDGAVQLDQLLLCESTDDRPQEKGEISNSPELTNEQGIAERLVRLGTRAGQIVVTAELRRNGEHISGSPQTFTLTALAGPAVSIRETSGNHQAGRAGKQLPDPFVVTVYDAFGNPVPGVAVNFSVVSGGGTLTKGNVVLTNGEGRAENGLILGTAGTQQIVRAEAPLIGSPVLFYARTLLLAARLR
ncbi:MAG: FG-GAP-like repeat-containing protein, partial [candidate division KSB1 bacterium]|nr:FG-GAP-like repeat-containing protein [candidate division KSB1 bacterium]